MFIVNIILFIPAYLLKGALTQQSVFIVIPLVSIVYAGGLILLNWAFNLNEDVWGYFSGFKTMLEEHHHR
jgi:hypothetical protein